jgi:Flp pilus assembly protein TadG
MRTRRLRSRARRGSTLVMVAIWFVMFVAVGSISADLSRYYVVTTELQNAADAAALAGAVNLSLTPGSSPESIVDADVVAFVAATQRADGKPLTVTANAVRMAFYTPGTNGAQGTISYALNGRRPNAVTVDVVGTPRGFFAQLLGRSGLITLNRNATAWIASLGSNCVRPWALPYQALYRQVMQDPTATSPLPDLDAVQFSNYITQNNSARYYTILGQNQTSGQLNDGEWNGFNFTGNAGRASFVAGINGCFDERINPDAGEGVTLPGQADQYVNWSIDAIAGGGNGANAQPGICSFNTGFADCYAPATATTPRGTTPGVTINTAWGELLGVGSNGINFDYVGEFELMCFYRTSADVCNNAKPGTPNSGYPPGTIVGYIKKLKSRWITPDDVLGNFTTNITRVVLVE